MAKFTEIAKWAGRTSTTRIEKDNKNSAYIALSLLVDAEQRIGYLDLSTESETPVFGFAPLPVYAAPLFKVTKLDYREESLGTKVLAESRHMVEDKDTVFCAIDLRMNKPVDADAPVELDAPKEEICVLGKWRSQRKNGMLEYTGKGFAAPLQGVSDEVILSALIKEANRINRNEPAVDTRVKVWNKVESDVTAFGKFKAQEALARKIRKG